METTSLIEQKKSMRKEMRAKRSSMSKEERDIASHNIISRLIESSIYQESNTIMAYASMPEEIQLNELFDHAFKHDKTLAIPLIIGRGTMRPVFLPTIEDLEVGDFGIMTVRQDKRQFVEFSDIDCIIVPGAAFDRSGNRLGLGGGYYDRFLKNVPNAKRVALAFDYQLLDVIPAEPHDAQVDIIITESETLNFDENGGFDYE